MRKRWKESGKFIYHKFVEHLTIDWGSENQTESDLAIVMNIKQIDNIEIACVTQTKENIKSFTKENNIFKGFFFFSFFLTSERFVCAFLRYLIFIYTKNFKNNAILKRFFLYSFSAAR